MLSIAPNDKDRHLKCVTTSKELKKQTTNISHKMTIRIYRGIHYKSNVILKLYNEMITRKEEYLF